MDEDKRLPMKVVGRKGEPKVDVVSFDPMQRACQELGGRLRIPKGVWRFRSFEEADEWMKQRLTRPPNPKSQP
jgi:hypothetical protein